MSVFVGLCGLSKVDQPNALSKIWQGVSLLSSYSFRLNNSQLSSQVETIQVHHLVPHRHKVVHELLLGVRTGIDFRQRPQLGVRAEDQVDPRAGPFEFAVARS